MNGKREGAVSLRAVRADEGALRFPTQLVVAADAGGLDALYRRYAPYVAAVATRLLGRDEEVEDLVQDVFLDAMRGISGVRDPRAIKGWLARIAVRMSVKRLRKRNLRRALHLETDSGEYERLASPSATPEQRELIAKIYRVLDRLSAQTRVIWVLRHVLDEPLLSIAELSACSQSTVQRKLREAESTLAKELPNE